MANSLAKTFGDTMTPTPSHVATDELIETLERLEKEATPGPWWAKRIDYEEYGIDVSFEINAPRKSPVFQTIMVERHEVASVRADWANCELVTALRNHLPALISALKENKRLREVGSKILAKLDHPTASVTQWDADELRAALQPQGDAKS